MIAPAVRPRVGFRPLTAPSRFDVAAGVRAATRIPPLLLAAVLLHTAVLPQLRPFGVGADGMLLLAVVAGLVGGPSRGAGLGFGGGLLADCFLATPFGLSALVDGLVGWSAGVVAGRLLRPGWWVVPAAALGAGGAGTLLFAGLASVLGEGALLSGRLVEVALGVGLLNALLSPGALAAVGRALGTMGRPPPVLPVHR